MKLKCLMAILSIIGILIISCSKDKNTGTSSLSIRMTDAPGNYDSVLIDIQNVEITGNGGNGVMLNVNTGIYNLLDFVNGLDTLIATGIVESGKIEQIRLFLGSNNRVVVNNISYPLSTPSAQQSGLKLQVHYTFVEGVAYELLLDFDAAQSIVETGNGSYQLKPVIRVIETATTGSIKGIVLPAGVQVTVTAEDSLQSYSTATDSNGKFLLQGIPPGTYNLIITPNSPFLPVTIPNVEVTMGMLTDIGTVNL